MIYFSICHVPEHQRPATYDQAVIFDFELSKIHGPLLTSPIEKTEFGLADMIHFSYKAPPLITQKLQLPAEATTDIRIYTRYHHSGLPQRTGLQKVLEIAVPSAQSETSDPNDEAKKIQYGVISATATKSWFYSEVGLPQPENPDKPVYEVHDRLPDPEEIDFDNITITDFLMPKLHETPPVLFDEASILISWLKTMPRYRQIQP